MLEKIFDRDICFNFFGFAEFCSLSVAGRFMGTIETVRFVLHLKCCAMMLEDLVHVDYATRLHCLIIFFKDVRCNFIIDRMNRSSHRLPYLCHTRASLHHVISDFRLILEYIVILKCAYHKEDEEYLLRYYFLNDIVFSANALTCSFLFFPFLSSAVSKCLKVSLSRFFGIDCHFVDTEAMRNITHLPLQIFN